MDVEDLSHAVALGRLNCERHDDAYGLLEAHAEALSAQVFQFGAKSPGYDGVSRGGGGLDHGEGRNTTRGRRIVSGDASTSSARYGSRGEAITEG